MCWRGVEVAQSDSFCHLIKFQGWWCEYVREPAMVNKQWPREVPAMVSTCRWWQHEFCLMCGVVAESARGYGGGVVSVLTGWGSR